MAQLIALQKFYRAAEHQPHHQALQMQENEVVGIPISWRRHFPYIFTEQRQVVDINRRSWEAFKRAVVSIADDPNRFQRIQNRMGLNFDAKIQFGDYLRPRDVQKIAVGLADLNKDDLNAAARGAVVSQLLPMQLRALIQDLNPVVFNDLPHDPPHLLKPKHVESHCEYLARQDNFLLDRQRLRLQENVVNPQNPNAIWAYYERLMKAIIGHPIPKGTLIPAPEREHYVVDECIGDRGMRAFLLKPLREAALMNPMLVFASSTFFLQENALDTFLNDLEVRLGTSADRASEEEIDRIMNDPNLRPPVLQGYSLGGALLQRVLARHLQNVSHAIFYNDPSLEASVAEQVAAQINALPREPNNGGHLPRHKITIYRTVQVMPDGKKIPDWAHCAGEKHVGWGINHPDYLVELVEIEYTTAEKQGILDRHSRRFFDADPRNPDNNFHLRIYTNHNPQDYEYLQTQLDNTKRGNYIAWVERWRRGWQGKLLYFVIFHIRAVVYSIFHYFGVDLSRAPHHRHRAYIHEPRPAIQPAQRLLANA